MKRMSILALTFCACYVPVTWGQQPATKGNRDWTEFHRPNMMRCNPYEHVLNVRNVGRLELEWSYATTDGSNSSPAVANGVVYFGLVEKVYALNASTGSLLWTFSTLTSSSPAVANGVVYIGGGNDNNGEVYALNAKTGAELWSYTTTGNLT